MLRGVKSWLSATIPRLASSASPKVGVGAGAWDEPTRPSLLHFSRQKAFSILQSRAAVPLTDEKCDERPVTGTEELGRS